MRHRFRHRLVRPNNSSLQPAFVLCPSIFAQGWTSQQQAFVNQLYQWAWDLARKQQLAKPDWPAPRFSLN
jgi:hypothetical protein